MESADSLPTDAQHETWSCNNNTVGRAPIIYDFDSDDEDGTYTEEEAFDAVLPLCADFDSLSREEAGR